MSETRKRLPDTRKSVTKTIRIHAPNESEATGISVREIEVEITVGLYEDGTPGEVFLKAGKTGDTVSGLLDALAVCISIGLQSGVPLSWFAEKLARMQFQPSGRTSDKDLGYASSIVDAIARWLGRRFAPLPPQEQSDG